MSILRDILSAVKPKEPVSAKCIISLKFTINSDLTVCQLCFSKLKHVISPPLIFITNVHINHKCVTIGMKGIHDFLRVNAEYAGSICGLYRNHTVHIKRADACPSCNAEAEREDYTGVADVETSIKGVEKRGDRMFITTDKPI